VVKKKKNSTLDALLTLIQDEDTKVASLAMEQLLKLGPVAEEAIAHYQEANNPHLRYRMHQMSGVMARRRARLDFIEAIKKESVSLWDGVLEINALYDLQCSRDRVERMVEEMAATLSQDVADTAHLAAYMREQEFTVPEDDLLDVDLYLIEQVVQGKYGSSALLCSLLHHLGEKVGWSSVIVLHEGRFCLIDNEHLLLDPTDGWQLIKLEKSDMIHPCGRKDVWLGILSQLFLVVLVEGQLRDLHHFGDLLAALDNVELNALPYPLGNQGGSV
jgi:hypothetical protein